MPKDPTIPPDPEFQVPDIDLSKPEPLIEFALQEIVKLRHAIEDNTKASELAVFIRDSKSFETNQVIEEGDNKILRVGYKADVHKKVYKAKLHNFDDATDEYEEEQEDKESGLPLGS